jgi:nucleoside-diphosphate-sugar epimerase
MKYKKILVTGGSGFIGSALVRGLVEQGHQVRVLDNESRGNVSRLADISDSIEFFQIDIRDGEAVQKACQSMDSVHHLAFINGTEFFYSKPELVLEVGVKGMINLLDGCIKHNIKEFVLASSSEVYQTPPVVPTDETVSLLVPDPLNPRYSYGGGKIISELLAINYGRKFFDKVIIFRPHNVYGPDMGWEHVIPQFVLRMRELCQNSKSESIDFPIEGTGKETRSFVFIDDFTNGLLKIIEKGEHLGIYHIGTSEEVSIASLANEVGKFFNRNVNIISGELAKGGTSRRCPDIKKLCKLGYSPRFKLQTGIPIAARWYNEHAHEKPVS